MIPKIIHYCWFGHNPKPKLATKCIRSWRKHCKNYQFIEWNEDNFDISSAPQYVQEAYAAKKWAFVTDYVRLFVVYHNGGIYLDTDVEILRNIDELLELSAFFGLETGNYVNTGLGFGAEQHAPILKELMEDYHNIPFVLENGELDLTGCPERNTKVFLQHGLKMENKTQEIENKMLVFAEEYFCPKNYCTGEINITKNSYTIHHYDASWITPEQKKENLERLKKRKRKEKIKRICSKIKMIGIKILGEDSYKKLRGVKE